MTSPETNPLSAEEAVTLLRHALLVAGEEMGPDGDHWPVIKDTVFQIVKDWENLKTERAVDVEAQKHLYQNLADMEKMAESAEDEETKMTLHGLLKELRDVYDACFIEPQENRQTVHDAPLPLHLQRAAAIIDTLTEEQD